MLLFSNVILSRVVSFDAVIRIPIISTGTLYSSFDAVTRIPIISTGTLYSSFGAVIEKLRLKMDDAQCLRAKRQGLKSGITKLLAKIDDAVSRELENVNSKLVTESRWLLVSSAVTQLTTKRDQITELDGDIAAAIQNEIDLETEICDALTYHSTLEERIVFLTEFVRKAGQPAVTPPFQWTT